jgi:large subunit ribosomal protein L32e
MTTFLRRIHHKYHKLGKKKGKKRVWRKPKGRDNKMREKRRGYGAVVSVGYRHSETERKPTPVVRNINELHGLQKGQDIIVGNLGRKKKVELIKKAHEKGIVIININSKKFLKKNTKKENKK